MIQGSFSGGLSEAISFGTTEGLAGGQFTFASLFLKLADILSSFLAAAGVAAITFGALMYVLSLGDEGRAGRAKQIILYAIVGMIVGAVAGLGVQVVCEVAALNPATATVCGQPGTVGAFLSNLFFTGGNIIASFIAAAALAAIAWGAIMYATSLGDESRAGQAKRVILYAIIGLLIAGLSDFFISVACTLANVTGGVCTGILPPQALAANILSLGRILLSLVAALAAAAIVYGGYLYVTSQGDESRASQGKQVIFYAIIGLVIAGLAGIIVNIFI